MNTTVKTPIVKVGNSQGICLPKIWLEQLHLETEVEMTVESNQIVIRPTHKPRHDWAQQFSKMTVEEKDKLLDEITATQWEDREWEW